MTCEQVRIELPFHLRHELDSSRSTLIAHHLRSCPACAAESAEINQTIALLGATFVGAPSAQLRNQVLAAIQAESLDALLAHAVGVPRAGLKEETLAAIHRIENASMATPSPAPWSKPALRLLAAAAVLVGAVAVVSVMQGTDGGDGPTVAEGDIPPGHETQLVALDGMGPEGASVRHYRHDNFRVTLTVEGYEVTPPDTHYAVWVRGPQGDVGIGTFRLKRADDFEIAFAVGVNPSEYPEFVVTLEPNDGDARLDGKVVTSGRFDPDTIHHGAYND